MNKDIPKVAIVILNWNGLKHLSQFLPSVMASEWDDLEIVVGDNASSDGSVKFLQSTYPTIKIIQNDNNYGFTGGYNRVLKQVEADYLILLNSDIEVTPNWIKPVIDMMEADALIAAAAPKIKAFHQPTHFEHAGAAGGFIDSYGYPFCRGRIFYEVEEDKGQYNQSGEIFWASGAALFIKKKCWDESGGFDERFFAHMEEIDLCWRLKNMGYKVMYCAESEVFHVGGGTLDKENPFKTYLNFRNNLLLLKKNLPFGRSFFTISIRFMLDLLAIARFMNEGKRKDAWAISRAHQNFVRQMFKSDKSGIQVPTAHHSTLKCMYKHNIVWEFLSKRKRGLRICSRRIFTGKSNGISIRSHSASTELLRRYFVTLSDSERVWSMQIDLTYPLFLRQMLHYVQHDKKLFNETVTFARFCFPFYQLHLLYFLR